MPHPLRSYSIPFFKVLLLCILGVGQLQAQAQSTPIDSLETLFPSNSFEENIKAKYRIGDFIKQKFNRKSKLKLANQYLEVAENLNDSLHLEHASSLLSNAYDDLKDFQNRDIWTARRKEIAINYGWTLGDFPLNNDKAEIAPFLEVFRDTIGTTTIEEIRYGKHPFTISSVESEPIGSTEDVWWGKVKLKGHPEKIDTFDFLIAADRQGQFTWDYIDAWLIHENEDIELHQSGSALSIEKKSVAYPLNILSLQIRKGEKATLYIKFKSPHKNRVITPPSLYTIRPNSVLDKNGGYQFNGTFYLKKHLDLPSSFRTNAIYHHEIFEDSTNKTTIRYIAQNWDSLLRKDVIHQDIEQGKTYWIKARFFGSPLFYGEHLFCLGSYEGVHSHESNLIDVYTSNKEGGFSHQRTGHKVPLWKRPHTYPLPFFKLNIGKKDTVDMYIRVSGGMKKALYQMPWINLYHVEPLSLFPDHAISTLFYGILLGIFIIQFFYFLLLYLIEKNGLHLYLCLLIFGFFGISFDQMIHQQDIGQLFVSTGILPGWKNNLDAYLLVIYSCLMIGLLKFTEIYLGFKQSGQYISKIIRIYLIVFVSIHTILILFDDFEVIVHLSNLLMFIGVILWVYLIIKPSKAYRVYRRLLLIPFMPYMVIGIIILILVIASGVFNQYWATYFLDNSGRNMITALMSAEVFLLVMLAIISGYRTNRIKLEQKKALEESLEAQKEMNGRLQQVDRLKDQFLANTSHELRTPLNGIIGLSESLAEETIIPKHKDNLNMIISSGKRLSSLVNDILDFSKLKNQEIELRKREIDIHSLVDVVMRINQPLINGKNLILENLIDENLPLILADEDRLQQILFNLIGNATKFTETGQIQVSATEKDDHLEIAVSDTGIGIPENKREVIFQAFEQADGSIQREFAGTGLGLSISKRLVELHGGDMWVKSQMGIGSTFYFTLPLKEKNKKDPRRRENLIGDQIEFRQGAEDKIAIRDKNEFGFTPTKDPIDTTVQNDQKEHIHILVIDDEPINQQVIKNHLNRQNYQLSQAMNGEEALLLFEKGRHFDLVLLDIMMPRMSGYEVCQKIREKYLPSELPIIMVTAKNQVSDLVLGLDTGANDYIGKPFSKDEFLARVNTHINLQQINTATQRFVPTEFIHTLGKNNLTEVRLGDQVERNVTVFFSDIRDYTSLSESMSPTDNFRFVKAYAERMGPVIQEHRGFINQYLGDGIMAIFQHSPEDALKSAIEMQQRIQTYNKTRIAKNRSNLRVGMGLHTGNLVMGIIGDKRRSDATSISDAVNTASRMESLTKSFGANILLSEEAMKGITNASAFHFRYLGKTKVKGKKTPIGIYECMNGDPENVQRTKLAYQDTFSKAVELYGNQDFDKAIEELEKIIQTNPEDKAISQFLTLSKHHLKISSNSD